MKHSFPACLALKEYTAHIHRVKLDFDLLTRFSPPKEGESSRNDPGIDMQIEFTVSILAYAAAISFRGDRQFPMVPLAP